MLASEMLKLLKAEKVSTWFDLGLFLDRIKETPLNNSFKNYDSFLDFKSRLNNGGIAFISFFYSVDGASTECEKYVRAFKSILKNFNPHYIAGKFYETGEQFLYPNSDKLHFDALLPFDDWNLYRDFFYKKLERGSSSYNRLIKTFWEQTLFIAEKFALYIEKNDIRLLYLININSNPGNVSEALAIVLISEYMNIPVINNCHDFYWEGGNSEIDIKGKKAPPGPRDHFFKNFHLGEVFSLIETLYPWNSRNWISLNINTLQCDVLINTHGHNPANVLTIDTCVDIQKYRAALSPERKSAILKQIASLFENTKKDVQSKKPRSLKIIADKDALKPLIFSASGAKIINFFSNNIILLQPTRILKRKAIEVDFLLLEKLFRDQEVLDYFEMDTDLKITILVTGPIAIGQLNYFYELVEKFSDTLQNIPPRYKNKIFLGFMFSAFDKAPFLNRFTDPFTLAELYKICNMILLPSATEGRGLPIIEAAAAGIPIFCRRYKPEHVFSHVIGENLPKSQRLKVIAFQDPALNTEVIELVKQQLFVPQAFESVKKHNREVVKNRYSFENLALDVGHILETLFNQINSGKDDNKTAANAFKKYDLHINSNKPFSANLLNTKNRQYLAGFGHMQFMLMLKSLIDPSYFRIEEKKIRGFAMQFARELVRDTPDPSPLPSKEIQKFFNSVDALFKYRKGELDIRLDHSMSYRYRNKNLYPYRTLTPQELTGVINILYHNITNPPPVINLRKNQIRDDWHQNLSAIHDDNILAIDHTDTLEQYLKQNIPLALFPGKYVDLEMEVFILAPARFRLKLSKTEKIDDSRLANKKLETFYIIVREDSLGNLVTADILKSYIFSGANSELLALFKHGICQIIESKQKSVGLHFYEIGEKAAEKLDRVRSANGIVITTGDHSAMMTDIADLNRFHIGTVNNMFASKILDIPFGSSYIQWVPPGLRFSLAFPTPIQTGKSFSQDLKSFRYKKASAFLGEKKVLQILKKDAEKNGNPINRVLKSLEGKADDDGCLHYTAINGLYKDGMPWSGILAKIKIHDKISWNYTVLTSGEKPQTVVQFFEDFNRDKNKNARLAWNGGYILNPELVGKLGLPETFIGSPLGLIISKGKVTSPPLFNKAAFLVHKNGTLEVKKVNCSKGISIYDGRKKYVLSGIHYNPASPSKEKCYYDLLNTSSMIPGNGKVLYRLAGNKVKDVIETKSGQNVDVLPVGLVFSFPEKDNPKWKIGQQLELTLHGLEDYQSAIEAGPHLLENGRICINMESEGWKTTNSINTQAARLDYTDMRGPKIALGIDSQGDLYILTINGRIRESVGATHYDMAEVLKSNKIVHAMGFDPGGSSTLVVDGKTLNISPYNHQYEKDVYSLPPEPRAVANAFIVWEKKQ